MPVAPFVQKLWAALEERVPGICWSPDGTAIVLSEDARDNVLPRLVRSQSMCSLIR